MRSLLLLTLFAASADAADNNCDEAVTPHSGVVDDLNDVVPDPAPPDYDAKPSQVYYGTPNPTLVQLSAGQMKAIGTFGGCTGTIINDQWVITARHCNLGRGARFCIGDDRKNPDTCFRAAAVYDNRSADMTLVKLDRRVSEVAPDVVPIPYNTEALGQSWIGRKAEASGYGQQEDGGYGEREFTAEPIVRVSGHYMTIDGEGKRGVCFGDSGGPLMAVTSDGRVSILGVLSEGDGNCVGRDHFTRADTNVKWIEGYAGPPLLQDAKPLPEREEVECPEGFVKHEANTPSFRDAICVDAGGETYVAYHEGAWWRWTKTISAVEMRFVHPDTNQEKVIRYTDLALVYARGTLPGDEEEGGDAVTDSTDAKPEEETGEHEELRANEYEEYVPLGNALIKRLEASATRLPQAPGQP